MPTMLMAAAVAISGVSTTSAPGKYVSAASGWYANQPKEAVAVGAVAMNMITPPSVSTPKLIAAMAALDDSRCMTERYRSLNGGESCASERDHILCTGGTDARSIRPPEVMPV